MSHECFLIILKTLQSVALMYVYVTLIIKDHLYSGVLKHHLLQLDVQLAHLSGVLRPLGDKHVLDGRTALHRRVHRGFEVDEPSPSDALVTGHHGFTLR